MNFSQKSLFVRPLQLVLPLFASYSLVKWIIQRDVIKLNQNNTFPDLKITKLFRVDTLKNKLQAV